MACQYLQLRPASNSRGRLGSCDPVALIHGYEIRAIVDSTGAVHLCGEYIQEQLNDAIRWQAREAIILLESELG